MHACRSTLEDPTELELNSTKNNLQRDFDEAREEVQATQQKLLTPLLAKIEAQLKALAKEKGYALILESSNPGVLYHADGIDITDQVIERLNKAQ